MAGTKAEALQETPFFLNNSKRYQLLLRIHFAHLRQKAQSSSSTGNVNGGFVLTTQDKARAGDNHAVGGGTSSSELLTEASMSMSLAILETLGPSSKYF